MIKTTKGYYTTGEIANEQSYLNGLLHGEIKAWTKDGELIFNCYMQNNLIEGEEINRERYESH